MANNLTRHFAERNKDMKASEVRELLKLLQVPDMISFAGGFPNPETFPADIVKDIVCDVLKKDGAQALQYGITEGYAPLRESVAERMRKKGIDAQKENVLIVSGSQQVIDLTGKVFIDSKDTIVVSAPTYLAALTVISGESSRCRRSKAYCRADSKLGWCITFVWHVGQPSLPLRLLPQ